MLKIFPRFLFSIVLITALPLAAQQQIASNHPLPDAPQAQQTPTQDSHPNPLNPMNPQSPLNSIVQAGMQPVHYAQRLAREIPPGQQAVPLSPTDKLKFAVYQQVRPTAFATEILSAGWGQMLNNHPKYGTDSAAFGERLGAAALRQSSQAILTDGLFAIVFHQDTRYYRLEDKPFRNRVEYAAARVFIGKKDNGGLMIPNYAKLLGYAGSAMLTRTYYPAVSNGWGTTWEGYGMSLVTAMLGNEVREFAPDAIHMVFHRKRHG
jgi:hypothetical protein